MTPEYIMHCTSLDHSALHLQKGVLFLFLFMP